MNYYKPKTFNRYIGKKFKNKQKNLEGKITTFTVESIERGEEIETNPYYFITCNSGSIGPFKSVKSVVWYFDNKVDPV